MAQSVTITKSQDFFVVSGPVCPHYLTHPGQFHPLRRFSRHRHSFLGTMNGNNNGSNNGSGGQILRVEGTNVLRVPFGVRRARRVRPQRPDHWATLVLPFQIYSDPTPPPQAA
jgi:hypothetical protein